VEKERRYDIAHRLSLVACCLLLVASCFGVNPGWQWANQLDLDSWQGRLNISFIFVFNKIDFWCHEVRVCLNPLSVPLKKFEPTFQLLNFLPLIITYQHGGHTSF
jgi:hypothetical protein